MTSDEPHHDTGRILGAYRIQRKLGHGAMGVVYEAEETTLGRTVALKVLPEHFADDVERVERFEREAKALARVNHDNVVKLHAVSLRAPDPWISMELVEGKTLQEILEPLQGVPAAERRPDVLPLSDRADTYEAAAAGLIIQMLDGLHAIHLAGIVHRDIKPANVILTNGGVVKIADFGLARDLLAGDGLSSLGKALGTPSYMSPEQAAGNLMGLSENSDLFSVGAVLYELLTGRRPFDGGSLQAVFRAVVTVDPQPVPEVNPRVNRDLWLIVQRALEKNPDNRYQRADLFAQDLRRYLRREPVTVGRPGLRDRSRRFLFRQSWQAKIGALLVLPVLALSLLSGDEEPSTPLAIVFVLVIASVISGAALLIASLFPRGKPKLLPATVLVAASVFVWLTLSDDEIEKLYRDGKYNALIAKVDAKSLDSRTSDDQEYLSRSLYYLNRLPEALAAIEQSRGRIAMTAATERDMRRLQSAILVELGRAREALSVIQDGDVDAKGASWTRRLRSVPLLVLGKHQAALAEARETNDEDLVRLLEALVAPEPVPGLIAPPDSDALLAAENPWTKLSMELQLGRRWAGWSDLLAKLETRFEDSLARCPTSLLGRVSHCLHVAGDSERAHRYARAAVTRVDIENLHFLTDAFETLARIEEDRGDATSALSFADRAFRFASRDNILRTGALLFRLMRRAGQEEEAARVSAVLRDYTASHALRQRDLESLLDAGR